MRVLDAPVGRRPVPHGQYAFPLSPASSQASAALGIGVLNLAPWLITEPDALDRLGADIVTAGEAGSLFRPAIYADNGSCYPGALTVDPGTVDGSAVSRPALTVSTGLQPGLYWIGGAVQNVVATQPSMRCLNNWSPPVPLGTASGVPGSAFSSFGYSATGITGALPTTFPTARAIATFVPRLFVRFV